MTAASQTSSGVVRASAGALCLLVVAAGTGLVPVPGLTPRTEAMSPPPYVDGFVEPTEGVTKPGSPHGCVSRAEGLLQTEATQGPVTLRAELGRGAVLAGGEREVAVVCTVRVAEDEQDAVRQPVDLALVLDTSGSMSGSMGLLKRATLGIAERLGEGDRLTIVAYSSDARRVYQGSVIGSAQAELERAISALVASGGTNMSAGLTTAAEALGLPSAEGRSRRILLMTDGLANQGISDGPGLERIVRDLRGRSIAVSALGLGSSYDERLLGSMADAGGGAYHYVDRPEGLGSVYAAEVDALGRLRTRLTTLKLTPAAAGVEVAQVISWGASRAGAATAVPLGDLAAGRSLKVVARLKVPASAPTAQVIDLVRAEVAFVDVRAEATGSVETAPLAVRVVGEVAEVTASANPAVSEELKQIEVAQRLAQAREAAAKGKREEARRMVLELKAFSGEEALEYEAPSGERHSLDFDDLADDMAAGAGSERGRRAMKFGDAAARASAR
jgi:Ca-activated chloride channel family protein